MPKLPVPEQRKMHVQSEEEPLGFTLIRVRHCPKSKSGKGKAAHYILRCGCCKNGRVEIFYDPDFLEINGINGSVKNWRAILLPLLGIDPKTMLTSEQAKAKRTLARMRKQYP